MKEFKVTVTEKYRKTITIMAEDREDALDQTCGMEINMEGDDYVMDSFEIEDIVEPVNEKS